jgi:uncharacterized protein (DUF305 family)
MFSRKDEKYGEDALWVAGLIGLLVGFLAASLLRPYGSMMNGWGMMGRQSAPYGSSSVARTGMMAGNLDKHFIEQMIPHHEDAVSMADLALTKAEHPELLQLAQNIKRDQTKEIGQMREWYASWYGGDVPEFAGGMMQGGMGRGTMMGMMGDGTDLGSLNAAKQFDKEFIEQMIPHHQMAIMMAQMMLSGTEREELRTLGDNIIKSQSAEIVQMREWYKAWYGR